MEIVRISNEKIKVSLSDSDMVLLEISCDMLDGSSDIGREAFNRIMDKIKETSGFETYGKRIFVQMFPSKDGGCEMFITKLNDRKYTMVRKRKNVCYTFHDLNCLIDFCNVANSREYIGSSSFYIDEQHRHYYICLERELPFATEFYGKKCCKDTDAYIKEHCILITEEAVSKLGALS